MNRSLRKATFTDRRPYTIHLHRSLAIGLAALLLVVFSGAAVRTPLGQEGDELIAAERIRPSSEAVANGEIVLREGLVVPPAGRSGRSPVHEDAIEALMVGGTWTMPQPGNTITLRDGSERKWEPIEAAPDGTFSHRALGGGYLHCTVSSDERQVMVLEASGHGMVYVNGEPRGGDPYQHGYVHVPVALRAGSNEFLFQVGRGRLSAKLVPPRAAIQIDVGDVTIPDLVSEQPIESPAAVVIINSTTDPQRQLAIEATTPGGTPQRTDVAPLLPLTSRKVGFWLRGPAVSGRETCEVTLRLIDRASEPATTLDTATITLRVRQPHQTQKRTFYSDIDQSVQYFAILPMANHHAPQQDSAPDADRDNVSNGSALVLTLHGAGVEAIGQADAYAPTQWAHIVAPTNRRPFGFDWEDWGRLDALEVLALARQQLGTDPSRTYLTGHSMGGHGVWQVGVHYPDHFAAIGPSAGWISMWSYAGARRSAQPNNLQELMSRAAAPSDTLALAQNYASQGVYILHGEKDDNVPVEQARTMHRHLSEFHKDLAYHEEPAVGHWWGKDGIAGAACVTWPPMFEFFQKHTIPSRDQVAAVNFTTVSPGVSAECHWVRLEAQAEMLKPSRVNLTHDKEARSFVGTTENLARLSFDLRHLAPGEPVRIELDGEPIAGIPWPSGEPRVWVEKSDGHWHVAGSPAASQKNPGRYGVFKDAFRNQVLLVYGTSGSDQENAWSLAKARYDAEQFWVRGNGSFDCMSDAEFISGPPNAPLGSAASSPARDFNDRNVILYGNADSNSAWQPLLGQSPVQVRRGHVVIGERELAGDDLACLFIRPRPGSDRASVGVVSGSGLVGMRLTDRLPYFTSGVAYPDVTVLGAEMLADSASGVRAAGFFGLDWSVPSGEFSFNPEPTATASPPSASP